MKGPRSRHKFYIARVWECPVCQYRAYTTVQEVNRACYCQGPERTIWMMLREEEALPARRRGATPGREIAG